MAGSTGGVVYVRPTVKGTQGSGAVVYLTHRQVAGLYSTVLTAANKPKRWKPSSIHPLGTTADGKSVFIDQSWGQFLAFLGQSKLGGANFPTLPELTNFILLAQQNATAVANLQSTLEQMVTANAQAQNALTQVVQGAGLTGAAQIPPTVLARPETAYNPTLPDSPGAGAGGDGGGGGDGG